MAKEVDADWVALGAFVRDRREELGLTMKAAAALAGVSYEWWRQLEQVPANRSGAHLGRAARALGVPLADLRAILRGER